MYRCFVVGRKATRNIFYQTQVRRYATEPSTPQIVKDYLNVLGENSIDVVELMAAGDDMTTEVKLLGPTFEISTKYGQLLKSYKETIQISKESKELAEMAEEELKEMESEIKEIQSHFDDILQLRDDADDLDVILETHGGAGGLEADLFAEELFDQYKVFVSNQSGWSWEVISKFDPNTASAETQEDRVFRAKITGDDVFRSLKWEAGVHRVQRIPVTESSGRIHTSTAGVKVFPVFIESERTQYKTGDFTYKGMRNTGAGGQGVNSTNTACQVFHKESGLTVREFSCRGYEQNRQLALEKVMAMLWQAEQEEKLKERGEQKVSLAFSLERHNRIRTYNWGRQKVHDHRLKTDHTILLDTFFDDDGEGVEYFVKALQELDLTNRREDWIKEEVEKQKELQARLKKKLTRAAAA
eukprot:TRINITY_DN15930_c0_g1_i1.p1 TRINITY_DN15930_c0_g1~~TRINITY_DN15930_c0_g1_i1.p1  ORF type:complete len:413 (+),score=101.96 TRINITY_DN15930_c0_g1_i1:29-1267(+)